MPRPLRGMDPRADPTATATAYAMAACWLSGDTEGLGLQLDVVVQQPAAAPLLVQACVRAAREELEELSGADPTRLQAVLELLEVACCEDPGMHAVCTQVLGAPATVPVLPAHLGVRGSVAAATACLGTALQLWFCAGAGVTGLEVARRRLLELAAAG